jgi:outer membrane protein assembly factor BamB
LHELEREAALEVEFEITDLDPQRKSSRAFNRGVHGQGLSLQTRLWMALFTILGVVLFSWLLVSPLHVTGAANLEQASQGYVFTPSNQVLLHSAQVIVVQNVIYTLDQDGLVSALWTRHKYVYVLWQKSVAPSSNLLRVEHNVVYLGAPDGSMVALRASDGAVLWTQNDSSFGELSTLRHIWGTAPDCCRKQGPK